MPTESARTGTPARGGDVRIDARELQRPVQRDEAGEDDQADEREDEQLVVVDADDAAEEEVGRLGRVALVEREEEHAEAEAEGEDGADRRVALASAQREEPQRQADGERAADHPDHRVDPDHERSRRAGEAELGDRVHREAQAAGDDEHADRAGEHGDDGAGEERGVDEVLVEQLDEHQWASSCRWWTCWSSGVPTTTMRPRTRRTSTSVS